MSETVTQSAPEPDDLGSIIGAAYDELASANNGVPSTSTPEAKPAAEAKPEAAAAPEKARGEDGKFQPAQPKDASKDAPVAEKTTEAKADEPKPLDPPQSLSAAARERWADIPRELQEHILQTTGASSKEIEQWQAKAKEVEPIKAAIEQHRPMLAAKGLSDDQAVANLLRAQAELERNPVEAIQWLAKSYGVDLTKFTPAQQQTAQQQGWQDPEIAALKQQVAQLTQHLQASAQTQQRTAQQTVQQHISEFAADPKNAHFADVKPLMGSLLANGQAKDLSQAYEMACRAHPQVSAKIADDERKAEAIRRDREARQAQERSVSLKGSPPAPGSAAAVPDSVEAALRAAWAA